MKHSQPSGQKAGRVILVLKDVVALVDRVKEQEGIANAEERGQATADQLPSGRAGTLLYVLR